MKIIMTKWLPASWKSKWSKEYIQNHPNTKRVNKDDLRAMFAQEHSKSNENFVIKTRDYIVWQCLQMWINVIVDDTNLHPKHEKALREIANLYKADFIIQDFTDVDVNECIRRDKNREKPVWNKIIKDMYFQFLYNPVKLVQDNTLEHCIICDIDWTLAKMAGRSPYDYTKVLTDVVNEPVKLAYNLYQGKKIIFSWRDDICLEDTKKWLEINWITYDEIHLRKNGDIRNDWIVKQEMYEEFVKDKYFVDFVLDDRDRVVDTWRSLWLTCFQVDYGNF